MHFPPTPYKVFDKRSAGAPILPGNRWPGDAANTPGRGPTCREQVKQVALYYSQTRFRQEAGFFSFRELKSKGGDHGNSRQPAKGR